MFCNYLLGSSVTSVSVLVEISSSEASGQIPLFFSPGKNTFQVEEEALPGNAGT